MTKWIVTRSANGTRTCYHTDKDCQYLKGTNYRPVSKHEIEYYNLSECRACAGDVEKHGGKDSKFSNFRYEAEDL